MGSHGEQRGSGMARGSIEHMCVREQKVVKPGLTQNMIFSPEVFLNERKNLGLVSGYSRDGGVELHGRKNRNKTLTTQLTVTDRDKGKRCFRKQKVL